MRWAGHVAHLGEERDIHRVLVGKPEGRRPGVNGRIVLRWISGSGMWGYGMDRTGSEYRQVADTCECSNETSGSV